MAEEKEAPINTDKKSNRREPKTAHQTEKRYKIAIAILGVVAVLGIACSAVLASKLYAQKQENTKISKQHKEASRNKSGGPSAGAATGDARNRMSARNPMIFGGGMANTANHVQGTVTAVGDGTITVAGSGKSKTVAVNDKTVYRADKKPAVNDTVLIFGSTSGETFTAKNITVMN